LWRAGLSAVALTAGLAVVTLHAQQSPVVRALTEPPPETVKVDGIEIVPVLKNVYMLVGGGANVTVQTGDQGVVFVDSGAPGRTAALLAAVSRLTRRPIRFLILSGPDADHAGGSEAIVKAAGGLLGQATGPATLTRSLNVGIVTISHENTSGRLSAGSPGLPSVTGEALPESTFFTKRKEIYVNGEPVQILHQPAAHTDGDVLVFFRGSDVVCAGDVYLSDGYPRIDLARGGSVQGEIDAVNAIIDLTVPERNQMGGTRVVPGHGHLANEADVVEYRDMLTIVRDRVQDLLKKGSTLPQVKAANPTLEYDGLYGAQKEWTGDMFLETVFRDLSKPKTGAK
jgi:glyoxylase-like metal-dependent hydrolase (beta-lactamase superfamily II)